MTLNARRVPTRLLLMALLATGAPAWAHVFPDHSEPRVGHVLDAPPAAVRVWFDGAIEPVFSTLRVEDAGKRRVDRDDARVDPADRTLLEVSRACRRCRRGATRSSGAWWPAMATAPRAASRSG